MKPFTCYYSRGKEDGCGPYVQMGDHGNEIDEVEDIIVPSRNSIVMVSAHMRMYCPECVAENVLSWMRQLCMVSLTEATITNDNETSNCTNATIN